MNPEDMIGFQRPTAAPYTQGNPVRVNLDTVEDYTLEDMGITVDKLKDSLLGINIVDPITGKPLADRFYKNALMSAVAQVEKELDIKILPRLVTETHDYYASDYNSYNFIQTRQRPVLQVEEFTLQMPLQADIPYPAGWWKVNSMQGAISILPTPGLLTGLSNPTNFIGLALFDQFNSRYAQGQQAPNTVPQLFKVNYVAGMLPPAREGVEEEWEIGTDLTYVIDKIAQRDLFLVYSRVGGNGVGIQSTSLSYDGLSETKSTTASAKYGLLSADIETLNDQIKEAMAILKGKYNVSMTVV